MKEKSRKYYRDMAIQAGEELGALMAECLMCHKDDPNYLVFCEKKNEAYYKMEELAAKANNYIDTPDYET